MKHAALPVVALLALAVPAVAVAQAGAPPVEYLTSGTATTLPFSEAVRVGNVLYLSGMVGVTPGTTQVVSGGIEAETRQVLDNIRAVLVRHGSSLDQVVKCTVMLTDMAEWSRMNVVYATYFTRHLPARSAIGANGLALGARVEIECIAVAGGAG